MFTGIVAAVGKVTERVDRRGGLRFTIECGTLVLDRFLLGESISISGCCLTASSVLGSQLSFDLVPETLACTNLSGLTVGSAVNLERALAVGDRLGGHWVLGHVDEVARVLEIKEREGWKQMRIELSPLLAPLVARKGSITVEGVSLTVARAERDCFEVALIPETLSRTTLGSARVGTRVNLEADYLARQVARLAELKLLGEAP